MAYVPGQRLGEEQEQMQAPQVAGPSAPSIGNVGGAGGGAAGSSEVAQANGPQGGTGFVNIDKYLAANKGAGQEVKARADKALANDQSAFSSKLNTATAQMKANDKPYTDPSQLVSNVTGASNQEAQAAAIAAAPSRSVA